MYISTLDIWIDLTRAVDGMKPPTYVRKEINDICNLGENDIADGYQRMVAFAISDLYDCLTLFFRTDAAISEFMRSPTSYFGGRSPWDYLLSSNFNRIEKRVDIIMQLVDRQYELLTRK